MCCSLVIWKLESSGCSVVWRTFFSPLEITDKMNPYFLAPGPVTCQPTCLWNNHPACSNKWYFYVSIRQTDGASDRPQSNNTTCWQSIEPAGIRCAFQAQYQISDKKWCNTTTGLNWPPWHRRRDSKSPRAWVLCPITPLHSTHWCHPQFRMLKIRFRSGAFWSQA